MRFASGDAVGWFDVLYRDADGQASLIPWADLEVNSNRLKVASFEDYFDRQNPPVRRFRVEYRRPG